ncbi:transporter YfdV [Brucella pseudogrignonensis]|uniref:Permease n=1 Tax=Brucella pseudogrignonensis TaxID=419475 RepID=A0ABU1M2Q4_9HYPH|nr:transporter YfdV [Brucella pseudogrignonensis]MDR6430297.1 putative permease [Brucella pseudogrignonensis]
MSKMLVSDLIPIFVVMILGYVSGKKNIFAEDQAKVFNKLVLDFALPAALFVSIVRADRAMLFENATLTIISFVGLVALFMLSYFTMQWFFKRSKAEAAVCALIAGSPTIGFLGYAILDPLYGTGVETGLVIAIVAIVVNAVTIPIGLYLLNAGGGGDKSAAGAPKDNALISALKEPVVWAPVLAVVLVLIGIKVPAQFDPTFKLLAQANSSVAVFAAGLTLAAYKIELDKEVAYNTAFKLILMPGVFLIAGWLCGLSPFVLQMLVLSVALPPAFSGIIISSRFQVYTRTGTSSLAVSVLGFVIAAPVWVYLAKILGS